MGISRGGKQEDKEEYATVPQNADDRRDNETATAEVATTKETTTTTIVEESQRYTDEGVSNDTVND